MQNTCDSSGEWIRWFPDIPHFIMNVSATFSALPPLYLLPSISSFWSWPRAGQGFINSDPCSLLPSSTLSHGVSWKPEKICSVISESQANRDGITFSQGFTARAPGSPAAVVKWSEMPCWAVRQHSHFITQNKGFLFRKADKDIVLERPDGQMSSTVILTRPSQPGWVSGAPNNSMMLHSLNQIAFSLCSFWAEAEPAPEFSLSSSIPINREALPILRTSGWKLGPLLTAPAPADLSRAQDPQCSACSPTLNSFCTT